jgi:predicted transposase/invertase (TIGR01784 family)
MAIGISPTVDFAFKLMLGSPEHSAVTIHFLNAVLGGAPKIQRVDFLNPFQGKKYDEDKLSILDIMAIDEHHRRLNIEMQSSATTELAQRLTYYNARSYVGQLTEGALYTALRTSISICVLGNPLFPRVPELHLDFRLREKSGLILTDDLQIHLLQLTNLKTTRENLARATPQVRWAFFLLHGGEMTYEQICELFPEPEFVEAAGVLEMINQTPEEHARYASRLKSQLDEASKIDSALTDGRREGRIEGRQEGRREGQIQLVQTLQRLVSTPESSIEQLSGFSEAQLIEMSEQLQQQLRVRGT